MNVSIAVVFFMLMVVILKGLTKAIRLMIITRMNVIIVYGLKTLNEYLNFLRNRML